MGNMDGVGSRGQIPEDFAKVNADIITSSKSRKDLFAPKPGFMGRIEAIVERARSYFTNGPSEEFTKGFDFGLEQSKYTKEFNKFLDPQDAKNFEKNSYKKMAKLHDKYFGKNEYAMKKAVMREQLGIELKGLYLKAMKQAGIKDKDIATVKAFIDANDKSIPLSSKEINAVTQLYNDVLGPTNMVVDTHKYKQIKSVATPEESKILEKSKKIVDDNKKLSSGDVKKLKEIYVKYHSVRNSRGLTLYDMKSKVIRQLIDLTSKSKLDGLDKKLESDSKFHKYIENPKNMIEINTRHKVYKKEGEWKDLDLTLYAFTELKVVERTWDNNDDEISILDRLKGVGVISEKEDKLLQRFSNPELSKTLLPEERKELRTLFNEKLRPIENALLRPEKDPLSAKGKKLLIKGTLFTASDFNALKAVFANKFMAFVANKQ